MIDLLYLIVQLAAIDHAGQMQSVPTAVLLPSTWQAARQSTQCF
jgi:hypothetical protein